MTGRSLEKYRSGDTPLPVPNLGWNLYGVGVESMGGPDGGPEPIEIPPTGPAGGHDGADRSRRSRMRQGQRRRCGSPKDFKAAFKRLKKIDGYRWIVINRADLFAANSLSIGSKAGILDASGAILKAADTPRKKI